MPRPRKAVVKPKRKPMTGHGAYRSRRAVRGRGFYKGFARDLGYGLGRVGNFFTGRDDLHEKGSKLGSAFSQITGHGAYDLKNVKANSLLTPMLPEIMNAKSKEGAVIVRNKEYLADVVSATSFTVNTTIDINPGLSAAFPWLSRVADAFEEYEILGMMIYYNTTSGNTTTSQALGEVVMSTEYNSYAPDPTNKQQQLAQIFAVSTVPSQNCIHAIECSPRQNQLARFYTRAGAPPAGLSLVSTDLGKVTVSVSGCAAAGVTLGEIYVDYEVAFYKPKLYTL